MHNMYNHAEHSPAPVLFLHASKKCTRYLKGIVIICKGSRQNCSGLIYSRFALPQDLRSSDLIYVSIQKLQQPQTNLHSGLDGIPNSPNTAIRIPMNVSHKLPTVRLHLSSGTVHSGGAEPKRKRQRAKSRWARERRSGEGGKASAVEDPASEDTPSAVSPSSDQQVPSPAGPSESRSEELLASPPKCAESIDAGPEPSFDLTGNAYYDILGVQFDATPEIITKKPIKEGPRSFTRSISGQARGR